jgi:predicted negative regulator of RcsB-dependent stress response
MESEATKKSFLRQWGALIALGALLVGVLGTFRVWTEYQADQPVVAAYQGFIDHLASNSQHAKAYQLAYQLKFKRKEIASQHFEQVCAVMTRMAEAQGVNADKYSGEMARGCRQLGHSHAEDELP